jgi:hypothetical protein
MFPRRTSGSLLGFFVVAELVDSATVGDFVIDDRMECLSESSETFVNSLPGSSGKVDAIIDLVPQGPYT